MRSGVDDPDEPGHDDFRLAMPLKGAAGVRVNSEESL
jgi:hypothetical protein